MKNTQLRFGRKNIDDPCLINEIRVIGKRSIGLPAKHVIPPHFLHDFQFIFVERGSLDVWIDGRVHEVNAQQCLLVRPYEIMRYVNNTLPAGSHYFIQLNTNTFDVDKHSRAFHKPCFKELISSIKRSHTKVFSMPQRCLQLLEQLIIEHAEQDSYSAESANSCANNLFIILLRSIELTSAKSDSSRIGHASNKQNLMWFDKVVEYIEKHLYSSINIDDLSHCVDMSANQLRIKLKDLIGRSPQQLINHKRIEQAKLMLCNESKSITNIAFSMGFSSSQYFSLFFKKYTSMTPFEYKQATKIMKLSEHEDIVSESAAAKKLDAFFKN
jgi:AraC-like DNA-binding protein/quercetin dioxygenase-like cupin family protein